MKKKVIIHEKDKGALGFFKDFFSEHPLYSAEFIPDVKAIKKRLGSSPPDIIIADSSSLEKMRPSEAGCSVIATVFDAKLGMKEVVRHRVENYILPPLMKDDLEYRLDIASKKKSYLDAIRQDKKHLEAMLELTYMVSSSLDPEEILFFIVRKLSEIIPVTRCSMLSVGSNKDKQVTVVSTYEDSSIRNLKLDLTKYPEIRRAVKTKEAVIVRDAMKDPIMKSVKPVIAPLEIKSIIVLPVVFRNEVIGTLFLRTSRRGHVFTEKEIKLCQNIANASATALNNAFLFEKLKEERERLERLSITDFLTGVYNTRYFYHRLESEFSRAQRYKFPLSCLMLDIDYFKKINDTYGHRTGDMVLREFANLIKKHTRKSDVFARYGGEEFILLLPQTATAGAVSEAERISRVIKKHSFKDLKEKQKISVSIGIAVYPSRKIKIQDDLIKLADDALLSAKEAGRNRILVHK